MSPIAEFSTGSAFALVGRAPPVPGRCMLRRMRPGLAQVRDTQFGVFTGWQVLCEYSRAEMRELIDRGIWVQVFRGVYREASNPPTARLRVEAARLCLGVPGLVAAYGTAARLHGLPVFDDPVTHVLGARPMRSPRLVVHPDGADARELDMVQGTTATGLVRTVVDVARTLSRPEALSVVEAALDRGISRAALFVQLESQRGRRGRVQADELVEIASATRVPTRSGELPAMAAPATTSVSSPRPDRAARWRTRCLSGGEVVRNRVPDDAGRVAGTTR